MAGRPARMALALAVVLVPIALTARSTLERDRYRLRSDRRLTSAQAELAIGGRKERALRNLPLLRAARSQIPEHGSYGWVPAGAFSRLGPGRYHQRYVVVTGWPQFFLAPRVAVDPAGAPWLLVLGARPARLGIHGRRQWRFGADWLVQR